MELNDRIAQTIKKLRTARNLTQTELAFKVGVDPMTISRIERKERMPSVEVFCLIAKAFEMKASELMGEVEK